MNMPEKSYGELWVIILGVFATCVFLAGIPEKLGQLFNRLVTDYGGANINNIPPEKMMLQAENTTFKIRIYFRYINLHREEELIKPVAYGLDILYKIVKN